MAQALLEDAPTLFLNAQLIDGYGGPPVEDGAVRVEDNRITHVGRTADWGENPDGNQRVIDLRGKALLPGLTEGHFHISFWGVRELPDLDLKLPAELSTIYAVKNAELALRCGYTSVASAGALHRVDVTIRDAINDGVIVGPRMAASGRDICATSGMLDWNPSFWQLGMEGLAIFADGVEEVRKAVRLNIREGCDVIKMYVTGEGLLRGRPGLGYHWGILAKGLAVGISQEMLDASAYQDEWERGCAAMNKMREAGIRIVPGGDYGFVWCPHGEYAKDIELMVTGMGFSPMEAIVAATKHGSELMRTPDETGTIEAGKFADLLIVDGDPLEDITILQDRSKLAMVMKDGKVMVNTLGMPQELQPLPEFTMDIELI